MWKDTIWEQVVKNHYEYLNQVLPQVILDIDYRKNNLVI